MTTRSSRFSTTLAHNKEVWRVLLHVKCFKVSTGESEEAGCLEGTVVIRPLPNVDALPSKQSRINRPGARPEDGQGTG